MSEKLCITQSTVQGDVTTSHSAAQDLVRRRAQHVEGDQPTRAVAFHAGTESWQVIV